MKGLTVLQPWATLLAIGAKTIETRSWRTPYRGLVAIHAGRKFPPSARERCHQQPFARALGRAGLNTAEDLPLGAIVAVATLAYVDHIVRGDILTDQERAFGDFTTGRWAWRFENVVPLVTPIRCRGALGLWAIPRAIERQL